MKKEPTKILFKRSAGMKIKLQVKRADGAYDDRENGEGNSRRKKSSIQHLAVVCGT